MRVTEHIDSRPGEAALAATSRGRVLLLGALMGLTAFTIDVSLPAMPIMASQFGASAADAQGTLSGFLIGYAVGQLAVGVLSDRFGRRPVLILGTALFALSGLLCAASASLGMLIAMRAVEGAVASTGPVLARAVARDLFEGAAVRIVLARMTMVMTLAPVVAPVVGGALIRVMPWRVIFVLLGLAGLLLLAWIVVALPETSARLRAGAARRPLGADLARLFANPFFLSMLAVGAVLYSGLFAYLSGSSFVFIRGFGLDEIHYGALFALCAFSMCVGAALNSRWLARGEPWRRLDLCFGLYAALAGAIGIALAFGPTGLVATAAAVAGMLFLNGISIPTLVAVTLEPVARVAGSASAAVGLVQFAAGAASGLLVNALFDQTAVPMLAVIAGSLGLSAALYAAARLTVAGAAAAD